MKNDSIEFYLCTSLLGNNEKKCFNSYKTIFNTINQFYNKHDIPAFKFVCGIQPNCKSFSLFALASIISFFL